MILYDMQIKIKRLKAGSGNVRGFVATATGDGSIQPIAKESSAIADGQYGSLYVAYIEVDLPCRRGDQVTDENSVVYSVKDVVLRDTGPFPHKELVLVKQTI